MMKKEGDGCVKFVVLELVVELISVEGQSICLKRRRLRRHINKTVKLLFVRQARSVSSGTSGGGANCTIKSLCSTRVFNPITNYNAVKHKRRGAVTFLLIIIDLK